MHIFEYCEEGADNILTDEWHLEQQYKYNFVRYPKIDKEMHGKFRQFNKETLKNLLDPNYKKGLYVTNWDESTFFDPKRPPMEYNYSTKLVQF